MGPIGEVHELSNNVGGFFLGKFFGGNLRGNMEIFIYCKFEGEAGNLNWGRPLPHSGIGQVGSPGPRKAQPKFRA